MKRIIKRGSVNTNFTVILILFSAVILMLLCLYYHKCKTAEDRIDFLTNDRLLIRICQFNRTNSIMGIEGEYEVSSETLYKVLDDWKQWEIEE